MHKLQRFKRFAIAGAASLALLGSTLVAPALAPAAQATEGGYLVGTGMYDVTGAVAENGAFGYASHQEMKGLQQRLYSRAFIVVDQATGQRAVYVSVDTGGVFNAVRMKVLERLQGLYRGLYNGNNVMIGITHSHVAPAGTSSDKLYEIAAEDESLHGFSQQVFDITVDGIVNSIVRAHNNLEPGTIEAKRSQVRGITRNRSLAAYLKNDDVAKYQDTTETTMDQLEFTSETGEKLGVFNWFSTHATSFPMHWDLYSGDTKGYAEYLYEEKFGTNPNLEKTFVAAFPTSGTGDMVPAAGNSSSLPEFQGTPDDYYNVEKHGQEQFDASWQLFNRPGRQVAGAVDSRGRYVQFKNYVVNAKYTEGEGDKTLCVPARGFSFAAGGENGPSGIPGIYEGMTKDTFRVRDVVNKVDQSDLGGLVRFAFAAISVTGQDPCQAEKMVLLPDGQWGWASTVEPVQLLRIGNVAIIGVPTETGTMGIRHLRESVEKKLAPLGVDTVIFSGATNDYAGYVSTREEYAAQHYEGASTEFGPHELGALQQELDRLAEAMVSGTPVADDALPNVSTRWKTNRPGVVFDDKPPSQQFGQVLTQPSAQYHQGQTARAVFRGGHPKNNLRVGGTFLRVQRQLPDGTWEDYLTDRDWDTSYRWEREGASYSRTTVEWRIGEEVPAGTYRLVQEGDWKNGWTRAVSPYQGVSNPFTVS
ncbi:neutral/alkaline non-lysosomal ceramidase N-terminal domain-containing protein [Mobiluncus porci]|uniref:Neutral ceramidase n=1 Tax=Mobiluncus porci TaxID=2652278 RepID=A0A7K0K3M3_9ACTO|nr:neutral/alkaline non-lysosomal ceramidase N-terminal domain-containing protein [Mobiluncus porci]MST50024.1 neutral/alkaline ceramidase [Mobiluncus porci]